jgi:hypothetical protein
MIFKINKKKLKPIKVNKKKLKLKILKALILIFIRETSII